MHLASGGPVGRVSRRLLEHEQCQMEMEMENGKCGGKMRGTTKNEMKRNVQKCKIKIAQIRCEYHCNAVALQQQPVAA